MKRNASRVSWILGFLSVAVALASALAAAASLGLSLGVSAATAAAIASLIASVVAGAYSANIASFIKNLSGTKRVFISYARTDSNLAKSLASELREKGMEVWIDFDRIGSGDDFAKAIERGIADADYFVLIASDRPSEFALHELKFAKDRGVKILPLVSSNEVGNGLLTDLVSIPFAQSERENVEHLVKRITGESQKT